MNAVPQDLSALSLPQAKHLCDELRQNLVKVVLENGGHLASNLGIVEISLALCRNFDPQKDRILYDTGHQCYVHKMLTGRSADFSTLRCYNGLSGFPRRSESNADPFGTGHSGTGISAALGFAKANRLSGSDAYSVVVIGDGAFTGGMAFEALNNISLSDRLIIILNDNGMSISKSVGALKSALRRMRTRDYYRAKDSFRSVLLKIPMVGEELVRVGKGVKNSVKRSVLPANNLFEQYGLFYFGPADGNDLETVDFLLQEAKRKNRPCIIHLCTKKGKGYAPAEAQPTKFHGVSPKGPVTAEKKKTFSEAFGESLCRLAEKDANVLGVTAAMCEGVGMEEFRNRFPERFFDVGIAEEHGLTFCAALAAAGKKPVFALYSTFFQRSFDQLLHDAALQKLPAVICLDRAGLSGQDGATHHGVFDIALTLPVPGARLYAPVSFRELENDLARALGETECASVIRYPKGGENETVVKNFPCTGEIEKKVFPAQKICDTITENKKEQDAPKRVRIISFGAVLEPVLRAAEQLCASGISVEVVRFGVLKGYSEEEYHAAFSEPLPALFVEEGIENGSFSQMLLARLCREELCPKSRILAIRDRFLAHGRVFELWEEAGFTAENIVKEVETLL